MGGIQPGGIHLLLSSHRLYHPSFVPAIVCADAQNCNVWPRPNLQSGCTESGQGRCATIPMPRKVAAMLVVDRVQSGQGRSCRAKSQRRCPRWTNQCCRRNPAAQSRSTPRCVDVGRLVVQLNSTMLQQLQLERSMEMLLSSPQCRFTWSRFFGAPGGAMGGQ